ncbi:4-diphosphocytidyl-2-C-methyl-D-erythritol kinase [Pseudoclavibacter endophyticus]|uniref:4-diphosphocytidyl-2-C-methyl-D-erythritol kinase n=1 Tax=Pseudoclavibacter endophyticus TaxID=1778590 RepID=A0A6H9WPC1_9MICO|nr:4-(cytidine 5'-diphospho)-2-C-methyl-D-erythritol kinase [Pseudoclavibacter endophyticus]KAB1649581.1 4-(cytidine 5'-diphospho)-2-C-methyl-D-erythritol kinase [Pseudoclavibacter endophyticus]GGA61471.1 4-diphosphocytidyl-2-C-methyl-D-erythritol kinase [Pseudoclavibacter endophyticus]
MTFEGAAHGSVTVRAPGKINVALLVGRLMDDGYHDVATAYQAVSLFEDVRATPADDVSVSFAGPIATEDLPTGNDNLAVRAARLLARETGHDGGAHLHITKRVPVAGGMGGGSADAAATLVACDALWGTDCGRDDLLALGARLGADVPFALLGGTAIGTGRGDQLSPALSTGQFHWVLAVSDTGMSTPSTYRALDAHRERHSADISPASPAPTVPDDVMHALRSGDAVALGEALTNDLQAAALQLRPELGDTLELGEANGALAGIVSGSGPTIAFLVSDVESAIDLQVTLSAAGHRALRVTGPVPGARILEA